MTILSLSLTLQLTNLPSTPLIMDPSSSSIQISPDQLQSELESIRSLRRISLSQPSSDLDPDLPSTIHPLPLPHPLDSNPIILPHPTLPATHHPTPTSPSLPQPSQSIQASQELDPNSNLFWLPARLHPEIAPQEFKAFIEEATKPENLLRRTSSALGSRRRSNNPAASDHDDPSIPTGLSRKKSMLSKLYDPNDHDPQSPSPPRLTDRPITRGHSMSSPRPLGRGAQGLESLTINDLQRLESLVFQKPDHQSTPSIIQNVPSNLDQDFNRLNLHDQRLRAILSRSLSIGRPPNSSFGPTQSNSNSPDPETIDDSPLISRAPGQIIRRTARTKVRKTSLAGDGNGHRFPPTRRTRTESGMANHPHHPRTVSTTSNTSDETASNDLHSNRSSKESNPQPGNPSSTSGHLTSLDDHPTGEIDAPDENSSSLAHDLTQPIGIPLVSDDLKTVSKPSIHHSDSNHPPPSSEDDRSIKSSSRPVSMVSNSSLLDAYTYEVGDPSDDQLTLSVSSLIDSSNPSTHPPRIDSKISQLPFSSPSTLSADHPLQLSTEPEPNQIPSVHPIPKPNSTHQNLPYPGSLKPDGLKVVTHLPDPPSKRIIRSSEDLPSTTTVVSSTTSTPTSSAKSIPSSGTLSSTSPSTPTTIQPHRSSLPTTRSTPTLPLQVNPNPPASPSVGPKKRAWVKLGLASAVTPKKGKGKDKQKADVPPKNEAASPVGAQAVQVHPAQSGSTHNITPTTGVKKESGFLSGLFGGKSKKQDPDQDKPSGSGSRSNSTSPSKPHPNTGGGPTLPSELQAQQQLINPTASGGYIKGRFMSFYRLPIHVERAVYRLSHIKLANPRRPLYEQVLISNLMFWYLGVINKSQTTPVNNYTPQAGRASSSPVPPLSTHNKSSKNQRSGKTKSVSHPIDQPTSKAQKRTPGTKGSKKEAAVGRSNGKGAGGGHAEWFERDSSEGSSSEGEEERFEFAPTTLDGSVGASSGEGGGGTFSDSDSNSGSSTDDDEKPLGNRILRSAQNRSKHPSKSLNHSSSSPNLEQNHKNDHHLNNLGPPNSHQHQNFSNPPAAGLTVGLVNGVAGEGNWMNGR